MDRDQIRIVTKQLGYRKWLVCVLVPCAGHDIMVHSERATTEVRARLAGQQWVQRNPEELRKMAREVAEILSI